MDKIIKGLQKLVIILAVMTLTVIAIKYDKIVSFEKLKSSMHKSPEVVTYQAKSIKIKGVTKTYQFLYISDTHVLLKTRDDLGSYGTAESRSEIFHTDKGVSSKIQFPNWIRLANQKNVDAVLMGGDIVDYESKANYEYIDKYLKYLDMDYLYTLGNHDAAVPWKSTFNYKNEQFLSHYKNKDYECQMLEYPSFIICSVNDSEGSVSAKALKEFKQIYKKGKPIILMLHVPMNTEKTPALERDTLQTWQKIILIGTDSTYGTDNNTKEFMDLVLAKSSPVVEVLSGHLHFHHEDSLNENITQIVSDGSYKGKGLILKITGK